MKTHNSKTIYLFIYISIKQGYHGLLPFNEEDVYENIFLIKVNMNCGIKYEVNLKFSLKTKKYEKYEKVFSF